MHRTARAVTSTCLSSLLRCRVYDRVAAMDATSSPALPRSSPPPSSVPQPPGTNSQTPRRPRQSANALALDDDADDDAAEEADPKKSQKRSRRARMNGDVPVVTDAVGESVSDAFETFLKT
jgi:DNA replication licensing factor MCM6